MEYSTKNGAVSKFLTIKIRVLFGNLAVCKYFGGHVVSRKLRHEIIRPSKKVQRIYVGTHIFYCVRSYVHFYCGNWISFVSDSNLFIDTIDLRIAINSNMIPPFVSCASTKYNASSYIENRRDVFILNRAHQYCLLKYSPHKARI